MSGQSPDSPQTPPSEEDVLLATIARAVQRAQLAIAWERLWPSLARLLTVAGLFLAASWAGVWAVAPFVLRIAGVAIFAIAGLAALVPLVRFRWPNREEALRLPKTGWVRAESLAEGKWAYLKPREVLIPALAGVETKIWFGIEHGIRGFLVRRGDAERVYMLTLPPTPEYRELTGHDRMPALIDQDQVVPLAAA